MKRTVSKFSRARGGNIAVVFAVIAPVMIGLVGAAVDYAQYNSFRSQLQSIADMAAVAGARHYSIAGQNKKVPKAVAEDAAKSQLGTIVRLADKQAKADADAQSSTVQVDVSANFRPSFMTAMVANPLKIAVSAKAQAVGAANICVIALSENNKDTLVIKDDAAVTGSNCAVYSNSTHNKGLQVTNTAELKSVLTCSAGGYDGPDGNYDPVPLTDCPAREDPLSDFSPPAQPTCTLALSEFTDIVTTINPGAYCSGLTIGGTADVTFNPGVYFIVDSDLRILSEAKVSGDGVSFVFLGKTSSFRADPGTSVDFEAPTTGPMAGILMFQDRDANPQRRYEFSSNDAKTLVGAIYLPVGVFYVDASSPVAEESAYTAIIASQIEVSGAGKLVLNSDYADTDVPVPAGLANAGGSVRLRN